MPEICLGAVVDNAKVKWESIISVVNTSASVHSAAMMFTTDNQSQCTVCRLLANKKNKQVRKRQTLLANIKCWPTFWTHIRLLFANSVGQHLLVVCLRLKNASDDNEFGICIRPIGINFVNTWCYITVKAGQNRDRAQNLGQFNVPGDLVIFPGTGCQNLAQSR